MVSSDEKNMAMLSHLLAIFTGFVAPLIIYLVIDKKNKFAREHAKTVLNFQITVTIAVIVSIFLLAVLIGALLLPLVGIANIVFLIIGCVKASNGEKYKYPISIEFVK